MKIGHIRIAAALVGLTLGGCGDPTDLVPVTPPGAYIPKVSPDTDAAQALGEAAPSTNAPASTTKPATDDPKLAAMKLAPSTAKGETKTTAGGVKYETLKEGTGPELKPGQKAAIHYVGKLENGKEFDSTRSKQPPKPFEVSIGVTPLIKGWDEGIPGMKVGEVRKLTIPSEMGYGKKGYGSDIPADATLIFEVELVEVK
jgi:FKBP-type peptidyl-prolyl cis-trans isomerase FkpA